MLTGDSELKQAVAEPKAAPKKKVADSEKEGGLCLELTTRI